MDQTLLDSWLQVQCGAIPGAQALRARWTSISDQAPMLESSWPARAANDDELEQVLALAQSGGRPVVAAVPGADDGGRSSVRIAQPISGLEQSRGAIAVEVLAEGPDQQEAILRILRWGESWLQLLERESAARAGAAAADRDLQHAVLGAQHFQEAVFAAVGRLAQQFQCDRVALGQVRSGSVRLLAVSDRLEVGPRSDLTRGLQAAMSEALPAQQPIVWSAGEPTTDDMAGGEAHRALAEQLSAGAILSLPIDSGQRPFAVLTFVRLGPRPFDANEQTMIAAGVAALGALLALKQAAHASPWQRLRSRPTGKLPGNHGKPARYLLLAALVAGAFWLSGNTTYRVGGPAELQGTVQRALVAPFDGYIATAQPRAGERVQAGEVMAKFDDYALQLEATEIAGERGELAKQYRKALAGMEHAEALILKAQIAQVDARLALLDQRLSRTELVAPFDGVIVAGDLSRSLGKPVTRGEVLFEIAPLDSYRVMVEVPGRDVPLVASAQHGTLVLAGLPSQRLPMAIENVTSEPAPGVENGTFRVEAQLIDTAPGLRPGMRGMAKIEVGQRRRIWIWTHELLDWLRYRLWAWMP